VALQHQFPLYTPRAENGAKRRNTCVAKRRLRKGAIRVRALATRRHLSLSNLPDTDKAPRCHLSISSQWEIHPWLLFPDRQILVRLRGYSLQEVCAASVEVHGEHLVFMAATGKLSALFRVDIGSWREVFPRLDASCRSQHATPSWHQVCRSEQSNTEGFYTFKQTKVGIAGSLLDVSYLEQTLRAIHVSI
jgi:hypothetical protein